MQRKRSEEGGHKLLQNKTPFFSRRLFHFVFPVKFSKKEIFNFGSQDERKHTLQFIIFPV